MTNDQLAALINANYRRPVPTITEFIDDPYYLHLGDTCCQAVRETITELFNPDRNYREAALIWGIGAGKSFLTSIANAYIAYRTLCLRDPQDYYGLAQGSSIAIVNFSVTANQAKKVVFGEIAARIDNAPCFQESGFKRDQTIQSELRWPASNLIIFPGNSQATSAIGYNVLSAVVDEAAFLPDVEDSLRVAGERGNYRYDAAEELYNAVAKRILSRGNWRWRRDSLFCMISSPRYVDDFLERKAAEAQGAASIYTSRLPTWEGAQRGSLSGPTFPDAVCGEVPVEYRDQFTRNPEKARRDLGARPSEAVGGFFSDPSKIASMANPHHRSPFLEDGSLSPSFHGRHRGPLCVHVDLGLKRDACGIAGAYQDGHRIVLAFVKRILPADHGGEIDFAEVRQFILDLRDRHGWALACVSYDGWQSVESRQLLEKAGVITREISVDRTTAAYDTFKELLLGGRLDYYDDPDLRNELTRLELIKGRKVDHPPGGSKDVADAAAGAVYNLCELLSIAESGDGDVIGMSDILPGWQPVRVGA